MGLGLLLLRRTYTLAEYTAAVMIWLGVAGFTLVDSTVSPKFSTFGVSLLIIAVLGDNPKFLRHHVHLPSNQDLSVM
jgi:hypothetical protein